MKDADTMYRRLFSLAFKRFGCDRDDAHDIASHAVCAMLEVGTSDFNYGFTAVQNRVRMNLRNSKRRKTYQFPIGEEGEPMELKIASHLADAVTAMVANECLDAIEALPDGTREVMRLVALEFTPDEIAEARSIPKKEVYWRTQLGRRLLRDRDGYELGRKRGHHKFIGIRRDHHRWSAALRKGDEYHYLGYFGSAAEAAKAYDLKARELFGGAAKLNFPEGSDED